MLNQNHLQQQMQVNDPTRTQAQADLVAPEQTVNTNTCSTNALMCQVVLPYRAKMRNLMDNHILIISGFSKQFLNIYCH